MPVYIDPVTSVSDFGNPSNARLVLDGDISTAAAGRGDLSLVASRRNVEATKVPNWLIVVAVIGFILLTTNEGR